MKADVAELVGQIDKIHSEDEFEAWKRTHELSNELVRAVITRQHELLTANPQAALQLSEWLLSMAPEFEDPSFKALALRGKGSALVTMDDSFRPAPTLMKL
jgi:hypothetical protein